MSLPTPAGRYLSAEDLEVVYDQKKFQDAAEIDDVHLLHFKHDRTLFVRVPVNSSDQNPHDGYIWGQTKYGKDRVVVFRHQPTRKIIELYGAKCTSLNCTELNQPHIRKQIFQYQDQIYCYYFTTTDEPISIPSEGLFPVKKKRLTKNRADILTRLVIPGRTVKQALSTAREMGMTDVTKKQVLNVSRRCVDCVFTKNGPRARTSLAMAEKIKQENPDLTWFEQTNNVLTEFTSIRVFKDACKIFYEGCPPLDEWEAYTELVEDMINDKHLRESELPKLYDHYPNGVFFPSRLHVDTTYRLSDMYITVVLGETGNFLTKPSGKARVIPLLYMLHSSRSRITHEKAALALKEALMEHSNPLSPKKFPCLLLDGEEALQVYGETLNAEVIRCDVHLLSVIRYNHGGKAAADAAKPFLFGRMKEGTWHAGILGCFTLSSFNRRVEKCKNKLDPLVYDWIVLNKQMLMQHASSAAKLRGGHLIQFSTNNTNETFNKHIKANLTKMHSASQLIQKMDHFVSDSLKECWLSSIGASDCVKLKVDISAYTENQKLSHFKEIGLSGYVAMGLGCPRSLANGFDYRKVIEEEEKLVDLKITFSNSDVFHLENEKYSKSDAVNRYVTVRADSSGIHCNLCVITLPSYLCCHITLCLKSMEVSDRQRYWTLLARPKPTQPKNGFSKVCGQKPRDRLGTKPSAGNHVRVIKDVTNMSIFDSTSSTMASPAASLNSSSVSTPGDSSRRSSNRHRNRPDRYSPPYGSDTSVMASDVSQNPPSHNVSDFLSSPVY